jgi:hypothetical protein
MEGSILFIRGELATKSPRSWKSNDKIKYGKEGENAGENRQKIWETKKKSGKAS